jgi:uncharacterized membrane protein YhhN
MAPWILLCAASCAGLLVSEWREARVGVWIFKPIAATAFLAAALAAGALDSDYGRLMLAGLGLCWLGDVLLIPKGSEPAFLGGLTSFLLGHVVYAVAFASLGVEASWLAGAMVGIALLAAIVLRWLAPHLEGVFRLAVPAYVVVIGSMLATAIAAAGAGATVGVALGAAAFAVSDLAVARDRLVKHEFINGAWGLPLYFAAQLVLAGSVSRLS